MADLNTDVRYIKGVGEARARTFLRMGIENLRDLVTYFPRQFEDRTKYKKISELLIGETACVHATIASPPRLSHIRKGLDIVKMRVVDETGSLDITYFNQAYLARSLAAGDDYVFYGRIDGSLTKPAMTNPIFEKENARMLTGRIVPIYKLTAGISQKVISNAVRQGIDLCGDVFPDYLPEKTREDYHLAQAAFAYENIHFPADFGALELARRRLIFEELFIIVSAMSLIRGQRTGKEGRKIQDCDINEFYSALPFELTGAQTRAVSQVIEDLGSGTQMNRLIQGDVGSGKTVVAAVSCWYVWKAGHQSAFMVPTEILAEQHFKSLSKLFEPLGVRVGILTGSMTAKQKRDTNMKITLGEIDLLIGTHAILSEGVEFFDLGLVITDEQHRFGVNQRAALLSKGDNPHVLVMSATPIPRTLALMIYGDLDVSIIDELPPGRQEIDTFAIDEKKRSRMYNFMRKLISEGRQVYIVCPAIEEEEETELCLKSAEEHARDLRENIFPDLRVGLIHGKIKPKAKESIMNDFAHGNIDILVATTVIEVGIDTPNAALMVVENADRFGLSQLHQLRGRVGRGEHKSYCILHEGAGGEIARQRLEILCKTNNGFKISEEDLRLRGPGDFFGSRQHGLPEMHNANLAGDMDVLVAAQEAAQKLIISDPKLANIENRALKRRIYELFELGGGALN